MGRFPDMKDGVVSLVRDFFAGMEGREPFETELMEFRLRLRAKLLEITTSFPTEPQLVNRNLNYVLSALEEALREEVEQVDLSSEISLQRAMKTLSVMNDVLKEFMYEDRIRDKKQLSSLTGFIGRSIERFKGEHRKRFGGALTGFLKLLFPAD